MIQVGDYVEVALEAKGVTIVGQVKDRGGDTITVLEGHAFSVWGGSNAQRGRLHDMPSSRVRVLGKGDSGKLRIARETVATYERDPQKWDRQRAQLAREMGDGEG